MPLVEGAIFGFMAMLSLGVCDFLGKKAVDKFGDFSSLLFTQAIGFIPALLYIIVFAELPLLSQESLLFIIVTAFFSFMAWVLFYRGLAQGMASVIVPIVGSWGAVTTVLALLVLGEQPTSIQLLGILVIFAGVFLTAVEFKSFKQKALSAGAILAFAALLLFGVVGLLTDFVVEGVGPIFSFFSLRLVSLVFLASYAPLRKIKVEWPARSLWLVLIGVAIAELFGNLFFMIGIDIGMVSIVSAIVAAYTPVTVVLAHFFLHERILTNQKLGIVLTVVGLIGVSLA
ncbi:EamA family transporter [archaeon]